MDRRDFLKQSAAFGLGVSVASTAGISHAAAPPYAGNLYFCFNAIGGWDTTMLCDPKGNDFNRTYDQGEILTKGNITYAPVGANRTFFERWGRASSDPQWHGHVVAQPRHRPALHLDGASQQQRLPGLWGPGCRCGRATTRALMAKLWRT